MTLEPADRDSEHLRLLSIFHYVVAGIVALWACFPLIHLTMGVAIVLLPERFGSGGSGAAPPAAVGWFFILLASAFILTGWTVAACLVAAGRSLARRKRYLFCLVTAGVAAVVCIPFGTVLGVCTFMVLLRPSVRDVFEGRTTPAHERES